MVYEASNAQRKLRSLRPDDRFEIFLSSRTAASFVMRSNQDELTKLMKASVPGSLDPPSPGIEEWEPPRHTHPLMPSLVEYTVKIPSANGIGHQAPIATTMHCAYALVLARY